MGKRPPTDGLEKDGEGFADGVRRSTRGGRQTQRRWARGLVPCMQGAILACTCALQTIVASATHMAQSVSHFLLCCAARRLMHACSSDVAPLEEGDRGQLRGPGTRSCSWEKHILVIGLPGLRVLPAAIRLLAERV